MHHHHCTLMQHYLILIVYTPSHYPTVVLSPMKQFFIYITYTVLNVHTLSLEGCRCLTDASLEAISSWTNLRCLDLSALDMVTEDGLQHLNGHVYLEELSLGRCRSITDIGLELLLLQPGRNEYLKVMSLGRCCNITMRV